MIFITNTLDLFALLIQMIAAYMMFKNSPINIPEGAFIMFGPTDFETPKKKNLKMKRGFLILLFGFAISFISLIIKDLNARL